MIEAPIGAGGMASVHRARDTALDRTVAIKTMHPALSTDAGGRERFRREARSAAALMHPHVVAVHDVGEEELPDGQVPFLVMEYVEGRTLSHFVPRHPGGLPLTEALRFTAEILDALAASHARGLVHRDIKPANVMVAGGGSVKVMDFGIARALDGQATALTGTGSMVGTPHYMAPEQFESGRPIDGRADLYAVGVVLFQLLTGALPFDADSGWRIGYLHITAEPPQLAALGAHVPAPVQSLLTRALAKDPTARFPDARTMRAAVLGAGEGTAAVTAGHPPTAVDGSFPPAPTTAPANAPTAPASPHAPIVPGGPPAPPAFAPAAPPLPPGPPPGAGSEPRDPTRWLGRGLGHPLVWLLAFVPLGAYEVVLNTFDGFLASDLPPAVHTALHDDIPGWALSGWWRLPVDLLLLCALLPLLHLRGRLAGPVPLPPRAWSLALGAFWLAMCAVWALHFAGFTVLDDAIEPVVHQTAGLHSAVRVMGILPASLMLPVSVACACAAPVVLFRSALRLRRT
ncbi:serine/threonine-protein kinase [Streptomyces sp. CFMR 7]|uniref:serine/threonine-protein kinase n=1 Tax=Streptomyces sp. CFMR 7 TaxID=1649184 RepID=UPI0021B6144E|nr:serine/threonine-protein kinase [Streptomyces sp. CFMR 7]